MKLTSKLLACVAVAVGLTATPASAVNIDYNGQYTYLGAYTAPTVNTFSRSETDVPASINFEDFYIFTLNPPPSKANYTVDFTPVDPAAFTNFTGAIYAVSGFTCGAAGTACTPGVIGAELATDSNADPLTVAMVANLQPGQYAVVVRGTTTGNSDGLVGYSGQVSLIRQVPEPATMALFGLGLLGAGLARRRRS